MIEISPGWEMEIERGPDWVFARLHCPENDSLTTLPLADSIWSLLNQSFVYRLVLELDELPLLHSQLLGEIIQLRKRIQDRGGLMRLSGLSDRNHDVLRVHRLSGSFPKFADREQAVMGDLPRLPR